MSCRRASSASAAVCSAAHSLLVPHTREDILVASKWVALSCSARGWGGGRVSGQQCATMQAPSLGNSR